jgi:hypothetical protein
MSFLSRVHKYLGLQYLPCSKVTFQAVSLAGPPIVSFCLQEETGALQLSAALEECNNTSGSDMLASCVNTTKIIELKYTLFS